MKFKTSLSESGITRAKRWGGWIGSWEEVARCLPSDSTKVNTQEPIRKALGASKRCCADDELSWLGPRVKARPVRIRGLNLFQCVRQRMKSLP